MAKWLLTSSPMTEEPKEENGALEELRTALRHVLPPGVSASIRLSSGRTIYVTVSDISRTGACVVRRGELEVSANEQVVLDITDFEQQESICLQARVQWVSTRRFNTLIGLVFTEGTLLPGTMLDQYLDRTLKTPGSPWG
jgi:hypothetical protein